MFVQCLACKQSLPMGTAMCQFCGATVAPGPKPTAAQKRANLWHDDQNPTYFGKPNWIWPAYYTAAGWMIFSGVIAALLAFSQAKTPGDVSIFAMIGATINLIVGVGLVLRIEFIRGVVNFICGINLVLGVLFLFVTVPMLLVLKGIGVLMMLRTGIDIAINALMIYLVGETD